MMDAEKQALIQKFLKFKNQLPYLLDQEIQPCKSVFLSESARREGNILYMQKDHDDVTHIQILELYSKSVAFAPIGSEELAFGYGNRSAFLQHINKYNECIQDIDRALKITNSNILKIKLMCRKSVCLYALDLVDSDRTLEKAKNCLEKMQNDRNKQNLLKLLAETESSLQSVKQRKQENIETKVTETLYKDVNDFDSVVVQYNEKYGRHLVATRDFQPGEVIFIEKCYAVRLNLKKAFTNCHHCLNYFWSGIPCDNCNWAMFCSEECRTEALKNYHDIECPIIRYIESVSNPCVTYHHLGIRLMIMGVKEAGSIEQLKANLQAVDESRDTWFNSILNNVKDMENNFSNIYNLKCEVALDKLLNEYPKMAITVLYALKKYTMFFGECFKSDELKSLLQDENVLFIGSLLIKLFKIECLNRYFFSDELKACQYSDNLETCLRNMCCIRGSSITQVASLLNHSCMPNVCHCFTDDGKIIIFALQPIKKNSQIFDSYCNAFYESEHFIRLMHLEQYNFICDCEACINKWPAILDLPEDSKEIIDIDPKVNKIAWQIFNDIKEEIMAVTSDGKQPDQTLIKKLSICIAIESTLLPPTSVIICTLLNALNKFFSNIHSFKPRLIGQCSKSIKQCKLCNA